MALKGSKSFSITSTKSRHKIKSSSSTLKRPSKSSSTTPDSEKIGEISVSQYRSVVTDPGDNHKRRAIRLEKMEDGSLGFTLQTYGLYNDETNDLEVWTYVDYVAHDGPAKRAGMRPGDIIISIDGEPTETADHRTIVDLIRSASDQIMMVVLFQDYVKKVQLHQKLLKLKSLLNIKERQLEALAEQEAKLVEGFDISDSSDISTDDLPPKQTTGLRRTILTGSLPLLPSTYQPKLNKSASMTSAEMAKSRERHASAPRGGLGSEIRLLDPATIASVGACPSPQTMRRYPASPSFGNRRRVRRNEAMKKGVSPRLGVKGRTERYSSDLGGEAITPSSDSDSDEAFVNLSPNTTPPDSPSTPQTPTFTERVRPPSPLIGRDYYLSTERKSLGVPKVLTVLSPRSRTPEPRLPPKTTPVKVTRPHSPLVLEPVTTGRNVRTDSNIRPNHFTHNLRPLDETAALAIIRPIKKETKFAASLGDEMTSL